MNVPFWKMNGSFNDFIIIDNRDGLLQDLNIPAFVRAICRRKESLGADGVILIQDAPGYDFGWRFFNSDGSEAEMCGNGSRCAARFAYLNKIAPETMVFLTLAGPIKAQVMGKRVKVMLPSPKDHKTGIAIIKDGEAYTLDHINTGVPHAVLIFDDLEGVRVEELGRHIRFHPIFKPKGTNVNFVKILNQKAIQVRTYERGVEAETLACGTGAVASALVTSFRGLVTAPVDVLTKGGEVLRIYFNKGQEGLEEVYLEGNTHIVCKGELDPEAWEL